MCYLGNLARAASFARPPNNDVGDLQVDGIVAKIRLPGLLNLRHTFYLLRSCTQVYQTKH